MWELIRNNRRKSVVIFFFMGALLLALGWFLGAALLHSREGGILGLVFAGIVWLILTLIAYFSGDAILLSAASAVQVTPDVHPRLFNVVEEMKIAAGLPKMPKVYIINDPSPNAFAAGRSPENSSVAVTAGMLSQMNRDELQGVVAHEVSHILNRDVLFMTFAGVMLGCIALLSQVFLRSMWFTGGGGGRYRSSSSRGGGGQAQLIIAVVAIALAVLAPIMARIFYFAISRKREYLADASAARLTRYPEGLASALEKISHSQYDMSKTDAATAPLYIVNPLDKKSPPAFSWFSTHPPLEERIRILKAMTHGASLTDYQEAYTAMKRKIDSVIPKSGLLDKAAVPLRNAFAGEEETAAGKAKHRDMGDLMHKVNQYTFINCPCGVRLKVPPQYRRETVKCPRCGRMHWIIKD